MNGFVLMAQMTFDGLPIRLFATEEEFDKWMAENKETIEKAIDDVVLATEACCSDLVCLELIEFTDGVPTSAKHIMSLEEVGD